MPGFGGVDDAFEEYFRISEQLPTRIFSGVELNDSISENGVAFAGAVVLQPLPFASDETWDKVYATDLAALLNVVKTQGVEGAAKNFDVDEKVWDSRKATYRCNCSKHYLSRVLVSLGEETLRQIIREDGAARIHCHYCNTDYEFSDEDADKIFFRKHKKENLNPESNS